MANLYKIATGNDNAAGLTALSFPLVCSEGIHYPAYRKSMTGTITAIGSPLCKLEAPRLTDAQLNELFTAAGASTDASAVSAAVTVAIPQLDRTAAFVNYNATLHFRKGQDAKHVDRHWQQVVITLTELVAI